MSRTDESGRDGLRAAVERLAADWESWAPSSWDEPAAELRALLDEHRAAPAEEPAEVAVEEREALHETLAAHFILWRPRPNFTDATLNPPGEWVCGCSKKFGFSDSAIAHVADEIVKVRR